MIQQIRELIRKNQTLRLFIANKVVPLGLMDSYFKNYKLSDLWIGRLEDTIACTDNKFIDRVPNAGEIVRGKQIMHNGIKINLGSYYGAEIAKMLYENKGVHEPQEERAFAEILKVIPRKGTMIELGSFWSFYSMWFNKEVEDAINFMIEPDSFNIEAGKGNFALNEMSGDFTQAFISSKSSKGDIRTVCIDDFVKEKNIDIINLLHSDIQGYEYEMLKGAINTIKSNKVEYLFISTHTNEIHNQCLSFLTELDFFIIANADMDTTYSQDGVIVACSPTVNWRKKIPISQK